MIGPFCWYNSDTFCSDRTVKDILDRRIFVFITCKSRVVGQRQPRLAVFAVHNLIFLHPLLTTAVLALRDKTTDDTWRV